MEFPLTIVDSDSPVTEQWIQEMMDTDFDNVQPEKVNRHCGKCKSSVLVKNSALFCELCGRRYFETANTRDFSTQTPAVWMTRGDVLPEQIVFSQCGTNGVQFCTLKAFSSSFTVWPMTKLLDGPIANQITVCRVMISYWYKNLCMFCPWLDPKTAMLKETVDSRPDEGDEAIACCLDRLTKIPQR